MSIPSLDDEIKTLQKRASLLRQQLQIQTSTLISSPSTRRLLLNRTKPKQPQQSGRSASQARHAKALLDASRAQEAHAQQSLYRACASVTTFRVRDPDPNAVDGGAVLGLRVEAMSRGRFVRPYYVLLNRAYASVAQGAGAGAGGSKYLRVHRHTIPACIPLAGLAARYLPPPKTSIGDGDAGGEGQVARQNLAKFARALRRELVRYHNRLAVVADMRQIAGLETRGKRKQKARGGDYGDEDRDGAEEEDMAFINIIPADAEAKQISIEWSDGRTGRLVMDEGGEVVKMVVFRDGERDGETLRQLLGIEPAVRVEEITSRLLETSA